MAKKSIIARDEKRMKMIEKYAEKRVESGDTQEAWWPRLHSFSVGLEGSPDLAAAQIVADHAKHNMHKNQTQPHACQSTGHQ